MGKRDLAEEITNVLCSFAECTKENERLRRELTQLKAEKSGELVDVEAFGVTFVQCKSCEDNWLKSFAHNFNYCPNCGRKLKEGD